MVVISRIHAAPENGVATLHRGAFGSVELLRCNGLHRMSRPQALARRLHFTLPLVGSFVWHTDHEDVFADPTTLLCTEQGESFRMSHPHGGDESIVFTPGPSAQRKRRVRTCSRSRTFSARARTSFGSE